MTTTIDFTYTMTDKETKLNDLQRMCSVMMETIEALEAMRGTADEAELNEAIAEAQEELTSYENQIIEMIWNK